MISVTNLQKSFDGTPVLKGVNMCVQKGSIYGLLGKNGAGKTTLIQHLAGIYRPDGGQTKIEDQEIYENVPVKARTFCMQDEPYAFAGQTLGGLAKFYQSIYPHWSQSRYQELLADLQLDEKKRFARLSKGMKKQAAFLLAMSTMPDYLIMDEPVEGIDPIVRQTLWKWIIEDVSQRQMTVLISSHNLRELEGICDWVGILKEGELAMEMDLDQLRERHHKVQLALRGEISTLPASLNILHQESHGAIQLLILEGDRKEITTTLEALEPVLLDTVPLTLEEIFIYILGGVDDVQAIC